MDPDYEQYGQSSAPAADTSNKTSERRRISEILQTHIGEEIAGLQNDINETDKRLNETQLILDRLRAAMLISFYNRAESNNTPDPPTGQRGIHPAVKKEIGKSIPASSLPENFKPAANLANEDGSNLRKANVSSDPKVSRGKSQHRVIVGNVSKYIPIDMRQRNDQSSHKWMVYVRGPREHPDISPFVKKVWFFLHPTYKPNDLVEVTTPPFHLTRRGWGEFPVRVQLHLKDGKGRKVDVIHHLKLDSTYSGEQRLGAETHVDVEVEPADTFTSTSKKFSGEGNISADRTPPAVSTQDTTIRHPSPKKRANETDSVAGQAPPVQKVKLDSPLDETQSQKIYTKLQPGVACSESVITRKKPVILQVNKPSTTTSLDSLVNHTIPVSLKNSRVSFPAGVRTANGVHPPKAVSLLRPRLPVNPRNIEVKREDVRAKSARSLLRHNNPSVLTTKVVDKSIDSISGSKANFAISHQNRPMNGNRLDLGKNSEANGGDIIKSQRANGILNEEQPDIKKPLPVYVKCKLPNGTIMLVRKHVLDHAKQKQLQNDKKVDQQSPQVSEPLDSAQTKPLPSAEYIEDTHTLLTSLVKVCPLICSNSSSSSQPPLLPTFTTYSSWPVGKRRALEWQRAKQITEYFKDYQRVPGISSWTTKNVMVWCRRYMHTPCCPEDRLLPLSSSLIHSKPAVKIKSLASDLLNGKWVSGHTDADELVDMTDTTVSAPAPKPPSDTCQVALLSNKEDEFMRDVAGQAGVSLGYTSVDTDLSANATSYVLSKLYKIFMEQLLRSSHAAIEPVSASGDASTPQVMELRPDHVQAAITTDSSFAFLLDVFMEEQ